MKCTKIASMFTAACVVSFTNVATAGSLGDNVDVDFTALKTRNTKITDVVNGNQHVSAGAFAITVSGADTSWLNGDFVAFCIELKQQINVPGTYTDTYQTKSVSGTPLPALSPHDPMGAVAADNLSKFYAQYFRGNKLSDWTNNQAAAFQISVWEIVRDSDAPAFDLTTGDFSIQPDHQNKPWVDLASDWLDTSTWNSGSLSLLALSSDDYQDQILVVPTPTAALAGLAMLGGVMFSRSRRG